MWTYFINVGPENVILFYLHDKPYIYVTKTYMLLIAVGIITFWFRSYKTNDFIFAYTLCASFILTHS